MDMKEMILAIRKVGDPILQETCKRVDIKNLEMVNDVICYLKNTLRESNGCGIAAPQIGDHHRIIVINVDTKVCHYPGAVDIPMKAMINPQWKPLSEEMQYDYEGCLSVSNEIRGKVKRYTEIEYSYYTEEGEYITDTATSFTARLLQHEIDHLDGIIFMERVDMTQKNALATLFNVNHLGLRDKVRAE